MQWAVAETTSVAKTIARCLPVHNDSPVVYLFTTTTSPAVYLCTMTRLLFFLAWWLVSCLPARDDLQYCANIHLISVECQSGLQGSRQIIREHWMGINKSDRRRCGDKRNSVAHYKFNYHSITGLWTRRVLLAKSFSYALSLTTIYKIFFFFLVPRAACHKVSDPVIILALRCLH